MFEDLDWLSGLNQYVRFYLNYFLPSVESQGDGMFIVEGFSLADVSN
jgi:hypothetical protein